MAAGGSPGPAPAAPAPPPAAPALPDWFERNWRWLVPTGCLAVVLSVFLFVAAVAAIALGALRASTAYRLTLERARGDARAIARLGEPIEPRWWVLGSVNSQTGGTGTASLVVPVRGARGRGTLYSAAVRSAGVWELRSLTLRLEPGDERLELLPAPP